MKRIAGAGTSQFGYQERYPCGLDKLMPSESNATLMRWKMMEHRDVRGRLPQNAPFRLAASVS